MGHGAEVAEVPFRVLFAPFLLLGRLRRPGRADLLALGVLQLGFFALTYVALAPAGRTALLLVAALLWSVSVLSPVPVRRACRCWSCCPSLSLSRW